MLKTNLYPSINKFWPKIKAAGSSDFDYTYNAAIFELYDDKGKSISDVLIVRTQNVKNED